MAHIKFDKNKSIGKIKPFHAINNAPFREGDMSHMHYLSEAGIPYSRLHDTGGAYGGGVYVDIDNIFRDRGADENDPESYSFEFTDHLITHLQKERTEPFYRLGCTIENYRHIKPVHITPPDDPQKWARVCEHIIAHYNEGWKNGFHMNIRYWEIWNEPDNQPHKEDNPMWDGDAEQYYRLYSAAANHLKSRFPDIKIGGYASCGFYEILNSTPKTDAHISTRTEYFIEFFHGFLKFISSKEGKAPLDFFSWHSYSGLEENKKYAEYARKTLDFYGFDKTESIFNEWNPDISVRGSVRDALNIAEMMIGLHPTSIDMMMYYDGSFDSSYGGLFDPLTRKPFYAYYAFSAFNILYRMGENIACECDDELILTLAASSKDRIAVMVVNNNDRSEQMILDQTPTNILILDKDHLLTETNKTDLPPYSLAVCMFE